MCSVRFVISTDDRKAVERQLQTAQPLGHLRQVKSLLAILAVVAGQSLAQIALILRVHEQTVAAWGRGLCCAGITGAPRQKSRGRPPQLTPTQQAALATLMDEGPVKAGCSGACWRSPMIQHVSDDRCGVFSNGFYSAQLLKHLGLSSQKAAFVAAHLEAGTRTAWWTTTWPQMLRLAQARQARLLCGDDASFPPWGTLTSTWARRRQQPKVQTSGTRTGDTVFGLMAYCTGCRLYQGPEGRLHAAAYMALLTRVLEHTTRPILLIQEGAKSHTSAETNACFAEQAARLQVFQLPTSSPDDHPSEKRWTQITQPDTHVPYFPTFEALTVKVEQALFKFAHTPQDVLALCGLPTEWAKAAYEGFLKNNFLECYSTCAVSGWNSRRSLPA
jgi:transposase